MHEETALQPAGKPSLLGVWDFQRMNQLIVAYHLPVQGDVRLSQELVEYKLLPPEKVLCWPQGTGQAMASFLRSRGIEPQWMT